MLCASVFAYVSTIWICWNNERQTLSHYAKLPPLFTPVLHHVTILSLSSHVVRSKSRDFMDAMTQGQNAKGTFSDQKQGLKA